MLGGWIVDDTSANVDQLFLPSTKPAICLVDIGGATLRERLVASFQLVSIVYPLFNRRFIST
jgi:hypothetical protein